MAYAVDAMLGPKFDRVDSTAKYTLGTLRRADAGGLWMYVQTNSTAAIVQYHAVAVDSTWTARPITTANAVQAMAIGVAPVAIAVSSFGWIQIGGQSCTALFDATTDIDLGKPLAPGNTAGTFMIWTTVTQTKCAGAFGTATISGNTSVTANLVLSGYGIVVDAV